MTSSVNRVAPSVHSLMKELNILKPFRGKRSGVNCQKFFRPTKDSGNCISNKHQDGITSIPVRITERLQSRKTYFSPVKDNNVVNIMCVEKPKIQIGMDVKSINNNNRFLAKIPITNTQACTKEKLSACFFNAQSINNKCISVNDYIVENDFDIVAIAETWLNWQRL